jgi:hypothetical protein
MRLALLMLCLSSCAALKTGWARVTWQSGGVSPSVVCTTRIDSEGEIAMECRPLNPIENDLMWRREKQRTTGGET